MDNIFVVVACLHCRYIIVGRVASFVSKIFVVRASTTKTMNILPHENYQLYWTRTQFLNNTVQYEFRAIFSSATNRLHSSLQ